MEVFRKEALKLSIEASKKCIGSSSTDSISHLITVSCTGMYAPGLDFDLVKYLGKFDIKLHSLGLDNDLKNGTGNSFWIRNI